MPTSRGGGLPEAGARGAARRGWDAPHLALGRGGGSEQEQAGVQKGNCRIKAQSSWIYWQLFLGFVVQRLAEGNVICPGYHGTGLSAWRPVDTVTEGQKVARGSYSLRFLCDIWLAKVTALPVQGCPDTSHLGKQQRGRGRTSCFGGGMLHGAVERQGDTFTPSPPAPGQGIAAESDLTLGACGTDVLLCFTWTPPSLPRSLLSFPFNCLPAWGCLLQLWFVCVQGACQGAVGCWPSASTPKGGRMVLQGLVDPPTSSGASLFLGKLQNGNSFGFSAEPCFWVQTDHPITFVIFLIRGWHRGRRLTRLLQEPQHRRSLLPLQPGAMQAGSAAPSFVPGAAPNSPGGLRGSQIRQFSVMLVLL